MSHTALWKGRHTTAHLHRYLGDIPPAEFEATFYNAQRSDQPWSKSNSPSLQKNQGDSVDVLARGWASWLSTLSCGQWFNSCLTAAGAPERHLVPETIYQAIYVQGRGQLRRDLHQALRTGRARRPRRATTLACGKLTDMVLISQRPAEATDRAIPGHWEGDLIIGAGRSTAIGTLVERSTRYVMLLHLPDGKTSADVRDALIRSLGTLPAQLRRTLTRDQGKEMARHREFSLATDMAVYFCDPHSPWQRGSNENTNGLLRQYFPKGTDLSVHTPDDLAAVAAELNTRPRKTLDWQTPAERLNMLLAQAN